MATSEESLDIHQKALQLNLDMNVYGSLAEIGAGQEVARWFYRVGAASGTLAKTSSAYDMKVSDRIYGEVHRYVSKPRLQAMIANEYQLIVDTLDASRGENTRFFAFADTISARNYQGTNTCHGWMGIRMQTAPRTPPCDLLIHVNLYDDTNLQQQEALGMLGVNLIYGVFNFMDDFDKFLKSLLTSLSTDRLEIDYIECSGHFNTQYDHANSNLRLLRNELCRAVLFTPENMPVPAVDLLYKRPVLIERGTFGTPSPTYAQLLKQTAAKMKTEIEDLKGEILCLPEITLKDLEHRGPANDKEVFERLANVQCDGYHSMVTNFSETYHITHFIQTYSKEHVCFVLGIATLLRVLQDKYYKELQSGILSGMSRMLSQKTKIYVCSMDAKTLKEHLVKYGVDLSTWSMPETGMVSIENILSKRPVRHLFAYLIEIGAFVPIELH